MPLPRMPGSGTVLCSSSNDTVSLPSKEFQSLDLGLFCKGDWSTFGPALLSLFISFLIVKLLAAWATTEPCKGVHEENRAQDEQHLPLCGIKVLISFREQAGSSWALGQTECGILWLSLIVSSSWPTVVYTLLILSVWYQGPHQSLLPLPCARSSLSTDLVYEIGHRGLRTQSSSARLMCDLVSSHKPHTGDLRSQARPQPHTTSSWLLSTHSGTL